MYECPSYNTVHSWAKHMYALGLVPPKSIHYRTNKNKRVYDLCIYAKKDIDINLFKEGKGILQFTEQNLPKIIQAIDRFPEELLDHIYIHKQITPDEEYYRITFVSKKKGVNAGKYMQLVYQFFGEAITTFQWEGITESFKYFDDIQMLDFLEQKQAVVSAIETFKHDMVLWLSILDKIKF